MMGMYISYGEFVSDAEWKALARVLGTIEFQDQVAREALSLGMPHTRSGFQEELP